VIGATLEEINEDEQNGVSLRYERDDSARSKHVFTLVNCNFVGGDHNPLLNSLLRLVMVSIEACLFRLFMR